MSLNLTIDQGNSAAKLALWEGGEMVARSIETSLTPDVISHFLAAYGGRVDASIYCSVVTKGCEVMAWLSEVSGRAYRLTQDLRLPIAISYGHPGNLGADRIAAAVGALTLYPDEPLLVVDAGTAVTYDAVSSDGRFLGGNIAPGMNMRLEALHRFTARLPRVTVPREIPAGLLGHDTPSAMIYGAVYGIVGAIAFYKSHLNPEPRVVMTGGWASELERLCGFEVSVEPDLVSVGLNRIITYNEDK